ncbi:hypothetical protein I2492_15550 [Budviciaceae bacterium CWB-B4]|uniref:Uncharacterized protein n=1 Tax=Limnobaculum xujianqingii TaxID=2738837 RepID=A0A9D7AKS7_9GAMM|nr:DUF6246 family protein [Limnobaculum xujianqingii]MBK5074598.1 hypothetical protein [Limnobaculum xujianqingii]MBK5177736.1 hypothetical protein [Limnobaculum xujianqingii]
MTPLKEIGEMQISVADHDYFFRPSFSAMASIGSGSEIVTTYAVLNGFEVSQLIASIVDVYGTFPEWLIKTIKKPILGKKVLSAAMHVMQCCCSDDITPLVGEWVPGKKGVVYRNGKMPIANIIIIGRELAEHGIMGKAKLRKLQRHEFNGTNSYTREFEVFEYINGARTHFDMSRIEAEQLTMTEYQLLLKAKYPEEKGFTREEYDELMDADDRLQARLIAEEEAKRVANGR